MENKEQKTPKLNNPLRAIRKKVVIQAVIAIQTIVITIALIFGMSAAWYTNVLQTSGLHFEAEAWGFTGSVTVSNDPIKAGSGDTGSVGLTVTNTSDDVVNVSMTISKAQMVAQMQQRLYFYAETPVVRNGERMDRVYINTKDTYTYTVLSKGELVLSEQRSNDVLLKWQWVYDMLGYYFVGTVSETENAADGTTILSANVEDYLRPVEYDLDTAVFTDGILATANGMSKEDLLTQLSETDGYVGEITPSQWPGYYKVDVDENGRGTWIYLANWAEIQMATAYDSELGKAAADAALAGTTADLPSYIARLTLIGEAAQTTYLDISTPEALVNALQGGQMVRLQQDLTLTEPIKLSDGIKTVLDMNGHTLTVPANSSAIALTDAANLTVLNGMIDASATTKDVITVSGSNLTMSGVTIAGIGDDAIDVRDTGTNNSCVRLFECNIDIDSCAVYVIGNGTVADGYTQIIVEDCTFNSDYITIMGNGSPGNGGTDIQIYNSTLTGYYSAIYQPQDDSITRVTDSTLSGITGIAIKGGDLTITDSKIYGNGEAGEIVAPSYANSGFADTGNALYIEDGYGIPINVTIAGDETVLSSAAADAICVFEDNSKLVTLTITGGKYSSDVSTYVPDGYTYHAADGVVTVDPVVEETADEE